MWCRDGQDGYLPTFIFNFNTTTITTTTKTNRIFACAHTRSDTLVIYFNITFGCLEDQDF